MSLNLILIIMSLGPVTVNSWRLSKSLIVLLMSVEMTTGAVTAKEGALVGQKPWHDIFWRYLLTFPVLKSALPLHDILLMTWRQGDIGHLIRLPWQNVTWTIGTCTILILTTWWHKELISTFLDVFWDQSVSVISVEREERGFNMQPSDTISLDTRHSSHLFLLLSKICSGSRLLHGMLKFWHNWNICDNDKPRNIIRAACRILQWSS